MATKKTVSGEGAPVFPPDASRPRIAADVLPALRISVSQAARDLGITRQTLHRILAEEAAVTPEMALRLGRFCGNGAAALVGPAAGVGLVEGRAGARRRVDDHPEAWGAITLERQGRNTNFGDNQGPFASTSDSKQNR